LGYKDCEKAGRDDRGRILGMSQTLQPLKLGDPGFVLSSVAFLAERSFGVLGQFISPSAGKTGMDVVIAGNLSKGFAGLKLGYY